MAFDNLYKAKREFRRSEAFIYAHTPVRVGEIWRRKFFFYFLKAFYG